MNGGCYFPWAFGWLLTFLTASEWSLRWLLLFARGMEVCMPRALQATPRTMASDLQIQWNNLAHFCCAEFCHSQFGLFLSSPSPRVCTRAQMVVTGAFPHTHPCGAPNPKGAQGWGVAWDPGQPQPTQPQTHRRRALALEADLRYPNLFCASDLLPSNPHSPWGQTP